jgi:hypothetical protein
MWVASLFLAHNFAFSGETVLLLRSHLSPSVIYRDWLIADASIDIDKSGSNLEALGSSLVKGTHPGRGL